MRSKKCTIFISAILASIFTTQAVLDFHDEDFFGETADRYDWSKHPCKRICTDDEEPKICKYVFVVEQFSSMSKACYDCPFNKTDCYRPHCIPADGVQKRLYVANRQMPGPAIEVCVDDVIEVEVRNTMLAESTTMHWHGIKQAGSPYMDGVPYVTQCPILPGQKFRYTFNADASGTYFWHSHIGSQRSDGLFGPLIIHPPPKKQLHFNLYDYDEHHMIINDWMNRGGDDALVYQYYNKPTTTPDTILINGMGQFKKFERENEMDAYTPTTVFNVEKNKRYRFRVINAGAEGCPIIMSVDNHTMLVISLDSNEIEPVAVDAITTLSGERVDFVLNANQTSENYWFRYRGLNQCKGSNATNGIYQLAILRYSGAPVENPDETVSYDIPNYTNNTRVLNPFNKGTESEHHSNLCISLLHALAPNDPAVTRPVDQQIYIAFDFYNIDNYDFHRKNLYGYHQVPEDRRIGSLQFNHISLKMQPFPLLSQWEMLKPDSFCNASHVPGNLNCTLVQCACTHVIQVKLNSVVELIFVDHGATRGPKGPINHPLHLHGHFFRVISEENLDGEVSIERVKKLDKEGKIKRRLNRAPMKDTIKAPDGGYTIVRVYANNPGYWFFHCHFEQHSNAGMALVFKVGEHEDFPPVPDDFPKCGGFA